MIDLNHVEQYRENNRIEAKLATGGFPRSIWETYSAFANTVGGTILLGVEETRDKRLHVRGIPEGAEYIEEFWAHMAKPDAVSANILHAEDVFLQPVDGREIMVVQVPRAERQLRPVFLDGDPIRGSYRRDGEGDYHCSRDEVDSMLRDRGESPHDLSLLPELPLSCLRPQSLRAFRRRMAAHTPNHSWNDLPDEDFLLAGGAAGRSPGTTGSSPTRAGLLLFGRLSDILQVYPAYALEYRADGQDAPLLSGQESWSGNLFDFYQQVSRRIHRLAQSLAPGNLPLEQGLQEAAANAILHTDYLGGQGLHILHQREALQVRNGGLPRVSPDAVETGTADARNPTLARLFALIGVGSGQGRGLRSIYATWAQQGLQTPSLSESFGPDTTTLRLPLLDYTTGGLRQSILAHLTRYISATPAQLAAALHVSPLVAQKGLSLLRQDGLVELRETDGSRTYTLRA